MPLRKAPSGTQLIHYHNITTIQTASALVVTGECFFAGIIMTGDNALQQVSVAFDIWDSDGALPLVGARLVPNEVRKIFELGEDNYFTLSYDPPLRAVNGIYVNLVEEVGSVNYQVVYDQ